MKKIFLVALLCISSFATSNAQSYGLPPAGYFDMIIVFPPAATPAYIEGIRSDFRAIQLNATPTPITQARLWRMKIEGTYIDRTIIPAVSRSYSGASEGADKVRGQTSGVGGGVLVEVNIPTQTPEGSFNTQNTGKKPIYSPVAISCKTPTDYQMAATDIGTSIVRVAILDTGLECDPQNVNFTHPYLREFVDAASSRSFLNNGWVNDKHGHGTAVASIIVRSFGGTSRSGNCKIIPIKVLDNDAKGNLFDLIQGIDHAIGRGVDIINISIVSPDKTTYSYKTPIQLALEKAAERNILVVSAAGNNNLNLDKPENALYTACVKAKTHIVVGAAKCSDDKASFSNYSPKYVDVFAPGVGISIWRLTWQGGDEVPLSDGSSFAAPIVAGMAAVLRTQQTAPNASALKCALLNGTVYNSIFSGYCSKSGVISANQVRDAFRTCR